MPKFHPKVSGSCSGAIYNYAFNNQLVIAPDGKPNFVKFKNDSTIKPINDLFIENYSDDIQTILDNDKSTEEKKNMDSKEKKANAAINKKKYYELFIKFYNTHSDEVNRYFKEYNTKINNMNESTDSSDENELKKPTKEKKQLSKKKSEELKPEEEEEEEKPEEEEEEPEQKKSQEAKKSKKKNKKKSSNTE